MSGGVWKHRNRKCIMGNTESLYYSRQNQIRTVSRGIECSNCLTFSNYQSIRMMSYTKSSHALSDKEFKSY